MLLSLDYIAGVMDGEGHIGVTKHPVADGHHRYYGRLNITNQSLKMLNLVQQVIGGRIVTHLTRGVPRDKVRVRPNVCYRLEFTPTEAVQVCRTLASRLVVKKEQAELLVMLHDQIKTDGFQGRRRGTPLNSRRATAEALELREMIYEEMKALNHRDSAECRKIWVKMVKALERVTPSQAAAGKGTAEGSTTMGVSPNDTPPHERPGVETDARNSLLHTVLQ